MKGQHLSDEDIQQFVLDKMNCEANLVSHMQYCSYCQEKAETYKILFSAIRQKEKPVFDFDLSSLVLGQIPEAKKRASWNGLPLYLILSLSFVIALFIYFYWSSFSDLFRIYIPEIGSGLSTAAIWLLASGIIIIVTFQVIDIFTKYKQKANALNFH